VDRVLIQSLRTGLGFSSRTTFMDLTTRNSTPFSRSSTRSMTSCNPKGILVHSHGFLLFASSLPRINNQADRSSPPSIHSSLLSFSLRLHPRLSLPCSLFQVTVSTPSAPASVSTNRTTSRPIKPKPKPSPPPKNARASNASAVPPAVTASSAADDPSSARRRGSSLWMRRRDGRGTIGCVGVGSVGGRRRKRWRIGRWRKRRGRESLVWW
jgi:hypothetical protein